MSGKNFDSTYTIDSYSSNICLTILNRLRNVYLPDLKTLHQECTWLRANLGLEDKKQLQSNEARLIQFLSMIDAVIEQIESYNGKEYHIQSNLELLESKIVKTLLPVRARLHEKWKENQQQVASSSLSEGEDKVKISSTASSSGLSNSFQDNLDLNENQQTNKTTTKTSGETIPTNSKKATNKNKLSAATATTQALKNSELTGMVENNNQMLNNMQKQVSSISSISSLGSNTSHIAAAAFVNNKKSKKKSTENSNKSNKSSQKTSSDSIQNSKMDALSKNGHSNGFIIPQGNLSGNWNFQPHPQLYQSQPHNTYHQHGMHVRMPMGQMPNPANMQYNMQSMNNMKMMSSPNISNMMQSNNEYSTNNNNMLRNNNSVPTMNNPGFVNASDPNYSNDVYVKREQHYNNSNNNTADNNSNYGYYNPNDMHNSPWQNNESLNNPSNNNNSGNMYPHPYYMQPPPKQQYVNFSGGAGFSSGTGISMDYSQLSNNKNELIPIHQNLNSGINYFTTSASSVSGSNGSVGSNLNNNNMNISALYITPKQQEELYQQTQKIQYMAQQQMKQQQMLQQQHIQQTNKIPTHIPSSSISYNPPPLNPMNNITNNDPYNPPHNPMNSNNNNNNNNYLSDASNRNYSNSNTTTLENNHSITTNTKSHESQSRERSFSDSFSGLNPSFIFDDGSDNLSVCGIYEDLDFTTQISDSLMNDENGFLQLDRSNSNDVNSPNTEKKITTYLESTNNVKEKDKFLEIQSYGKRSFDNSMNITDYNILAMNNNSNNDFQQSNNGHTTYNIIDNNTSYSSNELKTTSDNEQTLKQNINKNKDSNDVITSNNKNNLNSDPNNVNNKDVVDIKLENTSDTLQSTNQNPSKRTQKSENEKPAGIYYRSSVDIELNPQLSSSLGLNFNEGSVNLKEEEYMSSRRRRRLNQIVPNPRKPRTADYNCYVCNEPYQLTVNDNPWWAVYHHECPACKQTQIPRIDINTANNAIELDPNIIALYGEGVEDSDEDNERYSDEDDEDGSIDDENGEHLKDNSGEFNQENHVIAVEDENTFDGEGLLAKEEASKLLVLMCHARTCSGDHSSEQHAEICKSTKYLMLHIRDCKGTDVHGRDCLFPWCQPCKKMLRHLTQCYEPELCHVCNPWCLPESYQQLRKLNQSVFCLTSNSTSENNNNNNDSNSGLAIEASNSNNNGREDSNMQLAITNNIDPLPTTIQNNEVSSTSSIDNNNVTENI